MRLAPLIPIQGGKLYRTYDKLITEFEKHFENNEMPLDRTTGAWSFNKDETPPWDEVQLELFLGEDELALLKRFWETFTRNSYRSNKKQKVWLEGVDAALDGAFEFKPKAVEKVE
jgi:hypothetical protein